jgi:hypothetical protein
MVEGEFSIIFDQKMGFLKYPSNSHRQRVNLKMVKSNDDFGGGGGGFGAGKFTPLKWRGGKLNINEEKGGEGSASGRRFSKKKHGYKKWSKTMFLDLKSVIFLRGRGWVQ